MRLWSRHGQRGDGKIGTILGLLLIFGIVYGAMKWVPGRTQNAEFSEEVERMSRRHIIGEINEDQLFKGILEYAAKEGIPLKEDDVTVSSRADKVVVVAHYVLEVPLIGGKTWRQSYDIETDVPKL
jgi:hypothetical protein